MTRRPLILTMSILVLLLWGFAALVWAVALQPSAPDRGVISSGQEVPVQPESRPSAPASVAPDLAVDEPLVAPDAPDNAPKAAEEPDPATAEKEDVSVPQPTTPPCNGNNGMGSLRDMPKCLDREGNIFLREAYRASLSSCEAVRAEKGDVRNLPAESYPKILDANGDGLVCQGPTMIDPVTGDGIVSEG